MATLCLAGQAEGTAVLLSDRAATRGQWLTEIELKGPDKMAKLAMTQLESGAAGLAGAGSGRLIQRIVAASRLEPVLQDLSAVTSGIARLAEQDAWALFRRLENLEDHLPAHQLEAVLGQESEGLRKFLVEQLFTGVQGLADSQFLYVRNTPSGCGMYRIRCLGTLIEEIQPPYGAIGSGTVAFGEWTRAVGIPPSDRSLKRMVIDLCCIYSIGLDTTNVVGTPVINVLRKNSIADIPEEDAATLINLTSCYLAGKIPRQTVVDVVRSVLEGEPVSSREDWMRRQSEKIGVPRPLIDVEARGRAYWLRRLGAPNRAGVLVGPEKVYAENLPKAERSQRESQHDFRAKARALKRIHSKLDNPLPDSWTVEQSYTPPTARSPEDLVRYCANSVLHENLVPNLWARVFAPLWVRTTKETAEERSDFENLRLKALVGLFLRSLVDSWPEWKDEYAPFIKLYPQLSLFGLAENQFRRRQDSRFNDVPVSISDVEKYSAQLASWLKA